jgi:predicted transposase YbfD/YdcC
MSEGLIPSIKRCYSELPDPRVEGRCDHKVIDMVVLTILAVICGADGWVGVETYGKAKEAMLRQHLELPNGIPSHDTLGRFFAALDGEAFQASFAQWVETVFEVSEGQVIALDGKTARRSHDRAIGKEAIHMLTAWATTNNLALGQRKVDSKSNEITAIPMLLKLLDVAGCIVTIDAMGCQTAIAQTIIDQKADYVLAVKLNQGHLYQDLEDWFAYADQVQFKNMTADYHQTINKNQGRIEKRQCWAIADPLAFEYIRHYEGWTSLQTILRVRRERSNASPQVAYYISSLPPHAEHLLACVRHHWAIENAFHWVLDVTFREDDSRVRSGNAPQNFAVLRHIALNILKQEPSQASLKQKRFRAALDDHFLLSLFSHV